MGDGRVSDGVGDEEGARLAVDVGLGEREADGGGVIELVADREGDPVRDGVRDGLGDTHTPLVTCGAQGQGGVRGW